MKAVYICITLLLLAASLKAGQLKSNYDAFTKSPESDKGKIWYFYPEDSSGKCSKSTECTERRTCVSGRCQGKKKEFTSAGYYFEETNLNYGKFHCKDSSECDGQRYCNTAGECEGVARPDKSYSYTFNEGLTGGKCPAYLEGFNHPYRQYFCNGNRWCDINGQCQGSRY